MWRQYLFADSDESYKRHPWRFGQPGRLLPSFYAPKQPIRQERIRSRLPLSKRVSLCDWYVSSPIDGADLAGGAFFLRLIRPKLHQCDPKTAASIYGCHEAMEVLFYFKRNGNGFHRLRTSCCSGDVSALNRQLGFLSKSGRNFFSFHLSRVS